MSFLERKELEWCDIDEFLVICPCNQKIANRVDMILISSMEITNQLVPSKVCKKEPSKELVNTLVRVTY